MSRCSIDTTLRKSPRGDWIATVALPKTTRAADKCYGRHQRRFATIDEAAKWLAHVVLVHHTRRAGYRASVPIPTSP